MAPKLQPLPKKNAPKAPLAAATPAPASPGAALPSMDDIVKRAEKIVARHSALHTIHQAIEDMYWMENEGATLNIASHDKNDLQITISPSARNAIIGIVRLLTASEPQFEVHSDSNPEVEGEVAKLCKVILEQSSEVARADITTDAVRATALFADTHLGLSKVDDMAGQPNIDPGEKARLEDIRTRTPFLLEAIHPSNGYPEFGRHGMSVYVMRMQVPGSTIKEQWGEQPGMTIDDVTDYWLNDFYNLSARAVWLDEFKSIPLQVPALHGLPFIPTEVQLADGSALWNKPEKMRQPILYGKYKGNWWKRENAFFTSLFTALYERGTGILLGLDDDAVSLQVSFAGPGIRYIQGGKPKLLSDSVVDPNLMAIKNQVLDPVDAESTIYKQTLGSNVGASTTPFSSLAMLSKSGELPLTPIEESVSLALANSMKKAMRWIKKENIDLAGIVDLKAAAIPTDLKIAVSLQVKLPQDTFRNAQIAETLEKAGDVSHHWVQTQLLQIEDPKAMRKEIWTENSSEEFYKLLLTKALQTEQTAGTPTTPGSTTPPPADQSTPAVIPSPGPTPTGGPAAAAAGAQVLPASGPISPPGTGGVGYVPQ